MSELAKNLATSEFHSAKYDGVDQDPMALANDHHRWVVDSFRLYSGQNVAEIGAACGNFSSLLQTKNGHIKQQGVALLEAHDSASSRPSTWTCPASCLGLPS